MLQAKDNPAANVADRTSTIRLTGLKTFIAGAKVFLKFDTNHGIVGWGEIDQLQPVVAQTLVQSLFELLENENPTRIEHLWQKLYRSDRDMRGGAFMMHTLAGIDMALWDIAGKLWGVPIHRLLGGPTRDKIRVYPSAKAAKFGGGPTEFSGTPAEIDRYVQLLATYRKKVGPDGIIILDAHSALPPPFLIQLASRIEPDQILFIEEPAVPGNIEVFKRLKEAIRIPLATGERDHGIWGFLPYLQERCLDVIQPDLCHTGGITQMKKIAAIAEAYMTPLAPHCVASEVGVTASLHTCAAIPFFVIHEYYPNIVKGTFIKKTWTVDEEGYASLPQEPGLGIEIDEPALIDYPNTNKRPWKWPGYRMKDGSIADY